MKLKHVLCQKMSRLKRKWKAKKIFQEENVSLNFVILVMTPLILMLGAIRTSNVQHLRHFLKRGLGRAGLRMGRHHAGRVRARVRGDRHQRLESAVLCFWMEVAWRHPAQVAVLVTCNIESLESEFRSTHYFLTNIFSDQKPLASSSSVVTIRKLFSVPEVVGGLHLPVPLPFLAQLGLDGLLPVSDALCLPQQ